MTDIRFRSLDSTRVYVLSHDLDASRDAYYRNPPDFLGSGIYHYDTLGDGDTAHTPTIHTSYAFVRDYCLSLATYLLAAEPLDAEAAAAAFIGWPAGAATDDITFAYTVKSASVTTYYSLDLGKVSRAPSKRHDKRWYEVPDWATGGAPSAYRILIRTRDYLGRLDRIAVACAVAEAAPYYTNWIDLDVNLFEAYRQTDIPAAVQAAASAVLAVHHAKRARHLLERLALPATGAVVAESSAA